MVKGLIIAGPTGVGKTELAYRLARLLGGHLISCDSVQVYRGLVIGANKSRNLDPTIQEYGIDLVNPDEQFTAADYYEYAHEQSQKIIAEGRVPIIVGGTGFYLDWIVRGRPSAPATDPDTLFALEQELKGLPWPVKLHQLMEVDPVYASTLSANDDYRLHRAMAVYRHTGKPLSSYPRLQVGQIDWRCIYLTGEREWLSRNIDVRCERMIQAGLIQEVQALHLNPESPAGRAIGYHETLKFLQTDRSDASFLEYLCEFQAATRQYSRRQECWFRRLHEFVWLERSLPPTCEADDKLLSKIVNLYEMDRSTFDGSEVRAEDQRVRKLISGDPKKNRQERKFYQAKLSIFGDAAYRETFLDSLFPK